MTVERNGYSVFRNPGSQALFIFERDGTLLRKGRYPAISLNDINVEVVEITRRLREKGINFGFISDLKGMERGAQARSNAVALIKILDEIMRGVGVAPDFWMAWPRSSNDLTVGEGKDGLQTQAMIVEAMQWYDVEKANCVVVSSSPESLRSAAQLGVRSVLYIPPQAIKSTDEARLNIGSRSVNSQRAEVLIEEIARLTFLRMSE